MGLETEYGISMPGHPMMNPMAASTQIVNAYAMRVAEGTRRGPRWDYDLESPLRDARGFDMSRSDADPSQLTDDDLGMANVVLTNGARLYVDHAHPEYSTPEVTNPLDAVRWDRAGARIMARAAADVVASGSPEILLYKNNTDNKGASYGTHENYLMRRSTPFAEIVRHLIPFFITRQVFTGSGRLGIGQDGRLLRYQLSQRADFFEVEVGLETTLKRPIVNTRDEPHADPEHWRRLHVIVGDANLCDVATYLKMGVTALVLSMLEDGALRDLDLMPLEPVAEMHRVSHDVSLDHRIALSGGRRMTALELQGVLADRAGDVLDARGDHDPQTRDVLDRWRSVLARLAEDPMQCAGEIDWVAKLRLLEAYRTRDDLDWSSHRLQAIDLQYSDVRPDRGLAARLEQRGQLEKLVTDDEVEEAVTQPPADTRAYFRGECLRRYPEAVAAASWDSVVFDIPSSDQLLRVPTMEPLRGTREHVGHLLDGAADAGALIAALRDGG